VVFLCVSQQGEVEGEKKHKALFGKSACHCQKLCSLFYKKVEDFFPSIPFYRVFSRFSA
jgi:hypothetical protein